MTSCKLRVKLRVTFSELFVEEYRKNRLMGRSVTRPLLNMLGKPTLFQKLRAKLRALFLTFCLFLKR